MNQRVLLDTQVLLAIGLEGIGSVPAKIRRLLLDPETERVLSAVSITEIAIKNSIGKIEATSELVSEMIADLKMTVIPFTPAHAHRMFGLPLHHREPFDRMIIAVALSENLLLIGGDGEFAKYKAQGLSVIWK